MKRPCPHCHEGTPQLFLPLAASQLPIGSGLAGLTHLPECVEVKVWFCKECRKVNAELFAPDARRQDWRDLLKRCGAEGAQ